MKEHADVKLSFIVVKHGKLEPMVLVSTKQVRGRRAGQKIIQSYMDRWACEAGFWFSKQEVDMESIQARKFSMLQNLISLATLAWGLLACYQPEGAQLLHKAKQLKPRKSLPFPFYSLLMGWQRLFAEAKTLFYSWWHKNKPDKVPIMGDLFDNSDDWVP